MSTPTHEPGGSLPPIGALFSETFDDLIKNIGPYVLAAVGFFVVVMPVGMVAGMIGMVGMYVVLFGGIIGSAALGQAAGDSDVGGLITAVGSLGSFGLAFVAFAFFIAVSSAVGAPFGASLNRAIAAHQRGEGTLAFNSAFSTATQDIGSSLVVAALVAFAGLLGMLFCYVGALVPAVLFSFAPTMVALHRQGALAAFSRCARHAMANPGEHVVWALVYLGSAMVSAYIPVIGTAFLLALNVRAYRKVFGDGPEPAHALLA